MATAAAVSASSLAGPAGETAAGIRARVDATLGMVLFIGSWSMAFGTLLLAFLVLRERVGTWPPPGVELPSRNLAALATAVLLLSSVALHGAVTAARAGRPGVAWRWGAGLALGLAFAALQTWLWQDLLARGSSPRAGIYESLFFGLTWIHAAHVALALVALLWMTAALLLAPAATARRPALGNVALFWHFMDVVWVLLFLALFVF